jgi:hypothetical protein
MEHVKLAFRVRLIIDNLFESRLAAHYARGSRNSPSTRLIRHLHEDKERRNYFAGGTPSLPIVQRTHYLAFYR